MQFILLSAWSENCASYGSTDDNFPDVDSTSLLGHSCDFLSVGDRSQSWDGMALGRASISGPEGVVGRVSSAGGRVSNGRRSLSRTSDLAYMVRDVPSCVSPSDMSATNHK